MKHLRARWVLSLTFLSFITPKDAWINQQFEHWARDLLEHKAGLKGGRQSPQLRVQQRYLRAL